MKKIGIALTILLTCSGLLGNKRIQRVATTQTDIAIVTQLAGSVQLRRRGLTRSLRQAALLNVGDVIIADNGGRAVIYQAYAPVIRVEGGETRTIANLSPPAPQEALRPEEFARLKRHHLNARQNRANPSPGVMGGPQDTVLTLLEPRASVVLEKRPTFTWTTVKQATLYVINVYNSNEEVIWTAETTDTRITYPENQPLLQPGEYKWDVTARLDTRGSAKSSLYDAIAFTVLRDQNAAAIERDLARARTGIAVEDSVANLVYISALIEYKRLPHAAAELKHVLEKVPQDQTLWELLMETYSQMKLWRAREDARRISDNSNPTAEMVRTLELRR
jgi:hypothetical protein